MDNITTPENQETILNHEAAETGHMDADALKIFFSQTWARRQALREIEAAFDGIFHAYPGCKESANHTHAYNLLKAFQEMEEKWDSAVPHSRYSFEFELRELINKHSQENGSGTPDFILAGFLNASLEVFNQTVQARDNWYGVHLSPGEKYFIEPPLIPAETGTPPSSEAELPGEAHTSSPQGGSPSSADLPTPPSSAAEL